MIRHAWHFYYALVLMVKVVCGSTVLRASHLNWALAFWRSIGRKCNCCANFGRYWLVIGSVNRRY
ncbi:DUF3265 domain-containing protein [Vibrio parahaemolyticus]|nr:DUF3265 domain-containing protein [Vibrio parahaemolyticus]